MLLCVFQTAVKKDSSYIGECDAASRPSIGGKTSVHCNWIERCGGISDWRKFGLDFFQRHSFVSGDQGKTTVSHNVALDVWALEDLYFK